MRAFKASNHKKTPHTTLTPPKPYKQVIKYKSALKKKNIREQAGLAGFLLLKYGHIPCAAIDYRKHPQRVVFWGNLAR